MLWRVTSETALSVTNPAPVHSGIGAGFVVERRAHQDEGIKAESPESVLAWLYCSTHTFGIDQTVAYPFG